MSGLYLPGMEMPTRCYTCPCADLEYYDCNLIPGTRIEQHKRLDDCPLVPVPKHGRLIDADEFFASLSMDDKTTIVEAMHINELLVAAPTIIPADPAKEGEG